MSYIDMHCDTLWKVMKEPGRHELRKSNLCVDVEKMRECGCKAQIFACFIHRDDFLGEDRYEKGYEFALDTIALGKKEFGKNQENLSFVTSYEEMEANEKAGKISAFLSIEEGGILNGKLERLETLYQEGIRMITLTWNYENCLGYPNAKEHDRMQLGLKPFGVEVVKKMNALGMVIDVYHLSDGGFSDVLKYSEKPVVATHSNCRKLCSHQRNLTDDMIQRMAEKGGISGVNFAPFFLKDQGMVSAEDVADHVYHMYQVGGEDFPALGTDFDGFDRERTEITDVRDLNHIYDVVKAKGFTERQMDKFWHGNTERILKEVLHSTL